MISEQQHMAIGREADEIDFITMARTVWRYKYAVGIVTAVFALIAVVLSLLATPIYRAEVVVTEGNEDGMGAAGSLMNQFGGLASLVGANLPRGATPDANAVLASRRLVEEFIKRHVPLTELFPQAKEPPTLWIAVKQFREGVLTIREDPRKGTKTLAMNWTDPAVAARWANDFVALANELLRTRALDESNRNIKYLNEQIKLTNVVEMQRVMYSLIETETKRLMLANGRAEYAFTIVDPAVAPEIRSSPRRTLMVLSGTLIGGLFGIVLVLAYDVFARRRRGAR